MEAQENGARTIAGPGSMLRDESLEQLSSLLRITLERGQVQLIPLRDEIESIEVYLTMQDRRHHDRSRRFVSVDPELRDVLVPAMIPQPIVENPYACGLSKVESDGELFIELSASTSEVLITVTNSGIGIARGPECPSGHRAGSAHIRSRPRLLYRNDWPLMLTMVQFDPFHVEVAMTVPLQLSSSPKESAARLGVG